MKKQDRDQRSPVSSISSLSSVEDTPAPLTSVFEEERVESASEGSDEESVSIIGKILSLYIVRLISQNSGHLANADLWKLYMGMHGSCKPYPGHFEGTRKRRHVHGVVYVETLCPSTGRLHIS